MALFLTRVTNENYLIKIAAKVHYTRQEQREEKVGPFLRAFISKVNVSCR